MKTAIVAATRRIVASHKSITSIVAKVERNIDELLKVAQAHADAAVDTEARAEELRRIAQKHRDEASRAHRVAMRLVSLID